MIQTEVLIVGGGPAGAACAWRLSQHAIKCLILDKATFPRSKPCAGWLTPAVFDILQIQPAQYPFDLTEFSSFKIAIRGFKFHLPTSQYAIRRVEFDAWLLGRSEAEVRHHKVQRIEKTDDGYLVDDQFKAKYLVGAGGTHCPVRQAIFPRQPAERQKGLILAKEEEFQYPIKEQNTHLWFFEKGLPGYAWYVPKKNGYVNVGIGGSASGLKAKGKTLNDFWDQFVENLSKTGWITDYEYHPAGYSYYLRQPAPQNRIGNALLIGDSLGLATLDMGEGIVPAIQSGLLAADAIIHNQDYIIKPIPRYSFPALLRLRK
jgi:flavin-dependent dehydrogenase